MSRQPNVVFLFQQDECLMVLLLFNFSFSWLHSLVTYKFLIDLSVYTKKMLKLRLRERRLQQQQNQGKVSGFSRLVQKETQKITFRKLCSQPRVLVSWATSHTWYPTSLSWRWWAPLFSNTLQFRCNFYLFSCTENKIEHCPKWKVLGVRKLVENSAHLCSVMQTIG